MIAQEKPKFYGRRKGRTIHKAKSFLLEKFLPDILISAEDGKKIEQYFKDKKQKYCLEIGFGDGAHLAAIAKSQPDTGFIGVEVYKNGVANLLSLITGLTDLAEGELPEKIELLPDRADNIRVFDDDVRLLFSSLPDACFDKVFLLFPDPWPKKKHAQRRFVNPQNLEQLARLIKKGGILQIATDHQIYKRWTMEQLKGCPYFEWTAKTSGDWRNPPADWFETKYQHKAIREGRKPVFFEFVRL